MSNLLQQLYNDPKTGFISAQKLFVKARVIRPSITLKQVKEWYLEQEDIQRHQGQRDRYESFKITSNNPNSWQADLTFWEGATIITAININSRIGFARLLKDKKADTVLKALKQFTQTHTVKILTTDNGSEFVNKLVESYFKKSQIEHYNNDAGDHGTMGKIERFNRTLKQRLIKLPHKLTQRLLADLIDNYNNTNHSVTKATPKVK